MVGVVGGEGSGRFFNQSMSQHIRGRKNPSIPAYLPESAQAFLPEFVGSRNRVQCLERYRLAVFQHWREPPRDRRLTLSKKFTKPRTSEFSKVDTKYPYPSKWRKLSRTRRDSGADKFNLRRRYNTSPADMVVGRLGATGGRGEESRIAARPLFYTSHGGPYLAWSESIRQWLGPLRIQRMSSNGMLHSIPRRCQDQIAPYLSLVWSSASVPDQAK